MNQAIKDLIENNRTNFGIPLQEFNPQSSLIITLNQERQTIEPRNLEHLRCNFTLAFGCHSVINLEFVMHCSMEAWGIFSSAAVVR